MLSLPKTLIAVVLAATSAHAQLPRPLVNYPLGLSPVFDQGYHAGTAAPPHTITQWPTNGMIPEACAANMHWWGWNDCTYGRARVYNVTYNDCPTPWVMCRCENADLSINQMANFFGRMPVHLRSTVRHVMAVHAEGCSAYALTGWDYGDIMMQGNCNTQSIWLHETGHQLDARGLGNGVGFSTSPAFVDALYNDTCVADDYGNTALWEEFAQMTVVCQSHVLFGGPIPQQAHPGCFDHQVAALESNFASSFLTYGGTCHTRIPPTAPVYAMKKRSSLARRKPPTGARVGPCNFDDLVQK